MGGQPWTGIWTGIWTGFGSGKKNHRRLAPSFHNRTNFPPTRMSDGDDAAAARDAEVDEERKAVESVPTHTLSTPLSHTLDPRRPKNPTNPVRTADATASLFIPASDLRGGCRRRGRHGPVPGAQQWPPDPAVAAAAPPRRNLCRAPRTLVPARAAGARAAVHHALRGTAGRRYAEAAEE